MPRRPIARFSPFTSHPFTRSCRGVVLLAAALGAGPAVAAVEWHPDLDTAQAAARISHRPVLAVFVASWDADTAAFEAACLGSPEAEAVLATCFEPVRVDIDDRPELARTAGVTHVPTACVLSADDAPLARFEMPDSPAEFVTAAILAARRVAAEQEAGPMAVGDGRPPAAAAQAGTAVFGAPVEPSSADSRLPRGSLARVTAKVRGLSAFATNQGRPGSVGRPVAISPTPQPTTEPPAASARSPWPAETTLDSPTSTAARATIEPSATPLASPAKAPWLDAPAQQPPQQSAQQSTQRQPLAAAPSAPTASAPLPEPAPAEEPKASWQSRAIAALQKPFGWGAKAADPPTMPPAMPRGPLAAVQPVPQTQESPPEADPHGSMPLGLEGYCPVTLVDRGSWTEGRAQWGARHRGRTYLFAGPEEQRVFLADPDRYAPALSGDDPVLALDRGACTPGQRRYGVTYRSRMYLFASPETRQAFTADPDRFAARIALAERMPTPAGDTRLY